MKRTLCIAMCLVSHPSLVLADGGTLRSSQRAGDYQISAFTSPAVLRVGEVDISVLVQDASTGQVRSDIPILVAVNPSEQPGWAIRQTATTSSAVNKLFRSALVDVPRAGMWQATVLAGERQSESLSFNFDVAPPPPAWLQLAPWIGWPMLVAALFVCHQRLASRREIRTRAAFPAAGATP